MDKMFNNFELEKITGANVILYKDLSRIKDILSLCPLIILYDVCPSYGHWTCVFENDEGLNFFDSLGYIPDDELQVMGAGKYKPLLLRLLYKTKKNIIYNHKKLQKSKPNINTCGRYCIARLLLSHMYADNFNKLFDGIDPDKFVTELTLRYDNSLN